MMKKMISCLLIFCLLCVTGCASIVSKSDYPVSFNSSPEGATITIIDKNGQKIYRGKTPAQITLKSGTGYFSGAKYNVIFEKEDCEPQTVVLEKSLDGWYIGNILFGGIIGLLIVDPATGAMWKLPPTCHAAMAEKITAFESTTGDQVQLATLDDVPEKLKEKMVPIQ